MSDRPHNPTLLVGLGAFGAEVVRLVLRDERAAARSLGAVVVVLEGAAAGAPTTTGAEAPASTAVPSVPAPTGTAEPRSTPLVGPLGRERSELTSVRVSVTEGPAPLLAELKARLAAMLDLGHFVAATEPTDARGPRCDVFVVADLGEAGVATAALRWAATLSAELRREFQSILHRGDGLLSVCPLLAAPRGAGRSAAAAAIREIAKVAREARRPDQLGAPVYVVEDQSGKYLLSRGELVRSFAAFLDLLLFSRLRDVEGGLRRFVEIDEARRVAPLATFACATLEYDHHGATSLWATLAARELVAAMRGGDRATIAEIAALSGPLVPERARVEEELWKEGSAGALQRHLEPPALDVPTVEWDDSPEDVVEHKLGTLWRARTAQRIASFRDEVERFRMDRLAAEIERNGKACLARLEDELARAVEREVTASPTGWARALELLRDARTRAAGIRDAIVAEVEAPDLGEFPPSPLDDRLAAVHEAAASRPRTMRLWVFGVLAALVGTLLTGGVVAALLRLLFGNPNSFFERADPSMRGLPLLLATAPVPLAIGAVLATTSTAYRLWKHRKRHHVWIAQARDELDQAMVRYLSRDVVGYFYRRLQFSRLLWLLRIYRRLVERIDETLASLERVRAALGQSDARLERAERGWDERLDAARDRGGILYRGLVAAREAREAYGDVRPPDPLPPARRFLRESLERRPWREAPFADDEALLEFCRGELGAFGRLSPFSAEAPARLRTAAHDATRTFLKQLALKLSPPLEIVESASAGARAVARLVVVPPEAEGIVEDVLGGENVRGGWEIRAVSGDGRRIHLLLERGELPLDSLALVAAAGEGRAP